MIMRSILTIGSLGFCALVFATDGERAPSSVPDSSIQRPSSDEIRKVIAYMQHGKDPILAEHKFCKEIGKEGAMKNECTAEVGPSEVSKGDKVHFWMSFLLPKEFKEGNLLIQYNQSGVTKNASQRTLSAKDGSMRYRLYTQVPATLAAGEYELVLLLDVNGTTTAMEKVALTIKPKNY